jgi:hypothetical protein
MPRSDRERREGGADAVFERMLLDSAHADGPPDEATKEAWIRFRRAIAAVAALGTSTAPAGSAATAKRMAVRSNGSGSGQ